MFRSLEVMELCKPYRSQVWNLDWVLGRFWLRVFCFFFCVLRIDLGLRVLGLWAGGWLMVRSNLGSPPTQQQSMMGVRSQTMPTISTSGTASVWIVEVNIQGTILAMSSLIVVNTPHQLRSISLLSVAAQSNRSQV